MQGVQCITFQIRFSPAIPLHTCMHTHTFTHTHTHQHTHATHNTHDHNAEPCGVWTESSVCTLMKTIFPTAGKETAHTQSTPALFSFLFLSLSLSCFLSLFIIAHP